MAGERELTEAERERLENSLVALGAMFVILHNTLGVVTVDIPDQSEPEPAQMIVGFDFLKSKYRVTVEQIVDDDGAQADRPT
jgi:hypothetical protein